LKKIWEWIQENSSALQGVAAIVVVIGALIAIPSFIGKVLRPDVVVRINFDESTMPPELYAFNEDVSRLLTWKAEQFSELRSRDQRLDDI